MKYTINDDTLVEWLKCLEENNDKFGYVKDSIKSILDDSNPVKRTAIIFSDDRYRRVFIKEMLDQGIKVEKSRNRYITDEGIVYLFTVDNLSRMRGMQFDKVIVNTQITPEDLGVYIYPSLITRKGLVMYMV